MRSNQQRVQSVLDSMNIKYVPVDIASDENAKHKMMAALKAANKQPPYLAPQFFFGDEYIGVSLLVLNAITLSAVITFFSFL